MIVSVSWTSTQHYANGLETVSAGQQASTGNRSSSRTSDTSVKAFRLLRHCFNNLQRFPYEFPHRLTQVTAVNFENSKNDVLVSSQNFKTRVHYHSTVLIGGLIQT